jgi:hypothetical protein
MKHRRDGGDEKQKLEDAKRLAMQNRVDFLPRIASDDRSVL